MDTFEVQKELQQEGGNQVLCSFTLRTLLGLAEVLALAQTHREMTSTTAHEIDQLMGDFQDNIEEIYPASSRYISDLRSAAQADRRRLFEVER